MEYQRHFQARGAATLRCATSPVPARRNARDRLFDRNRLTPGLGAVFTCDRGVSTRVEYCGATNGDSGSDQTWMSDIERNTQAVAPLPPGDGLG